jgi:arylsulfatase A-like enzyme
MSVLLAQSPRPKKYFTAACVAVIFAAVIFNQPLCAQTETNSASSGFAEKWQNAKERSSNAWEDVKSSGVRAWENAKEGSSNAWSSLKGEVASVSAKTNFAYSQKEAFIAQADGELTNLDQKIRQLSDKTADAAASTKTEAQQKLQSIKNERGELNQKLDDAEKATQEEWNKAQAGFQKAYDDTKNSVKSAWDWLKSKTN